jgi:hypothetical protein
MIVPVLALTASIVCFAISVWNGVFEPYELSSLDIDEEAD